jgi:hypothetical protein
MSATITRLPIRPPSVTGVRVVGALLRCQGCKTEWYGALTEWSEVEPASLRCPRCSPHSPEPPRAA